MIRDLGTFGSIVISTALHAAVLGLLGWQLSREPRQLPESCVTLDLGAIDVSVALEEDFDATPSPAPQPQSPAPLPPVATVRQPAASMSPPVSPTAADAVPPPAAVSMSAPSAPLPSFAEMPSVTPPPAALPTTRPIADWPEPSTASAAERAPRQDAVDAPPRPVRSIRPRYPRAARARGEEGAVVLDIRVDALGAVRQVVLARGSGSDDLDAAAVAAVRKARFTPAQSAGRAVAASARITIVFRLSEG